MTLTATAIKFDTEISEKSSKSLFIEQPKFKFTKIAKNLHGLMMTGCSKCSAAAYQTYSFCISMHPDSIITPAKVATAISGIAKRNGGKTVSEQTIRKHFAQLEKVDLVEREYLRDSDGKFLGGIWRFFSLPTHGKKIPAVDDDKNLQNIKEKTDEIPAETLGKKIPTAYNKERARDYKTNIKTNHPPNPPQIDNPPDGKIEVVVALKRLIKKIELRRDFNLKTFLELEKIGLTTGQMKTLIGMLNDSSAEGCGWLVWKAKYVGPGSIEDEDVLKAAEKKRIDKETAIALEAKQQSEQTIVGFKSGAKMMREALKRKNLSL
jgi:hypothetical protein